MSKTDIVFDIVLEQNAYAHDMLQAIRAYFVAIKVPPGNLISKKNLSFSSLYSANTFYKKALYGFPYQGFLAQCVNDSMD